MVVSVKHTFENMVPVVLNFKKYFKNLQDELYKNNEKQSCAKNESVAFT